MGKYNKKSGAQSDFSQCDIWIPAGETISQDKWDSIFNKDKSVEVKGECVEVKTLIK